MLVAVSPRGTGRMGLRVGLGRPGLTALELSWRLAWALLAVALVAGVTAFTLRDVSLADADQKFLRSGIWYFMLDVALRFLRDHQQQLLYAAALVVPGTLLLWTLCNALGRRAILRRLHPQPARGLAALLGLNVLRAMLGVLAVAALAGSAVFAWEASYIAGDRLPRDFFAILGVTAGLVLALWTALAWLLWLAAVPAVAGQRTFAAVATAWRLWRSRAGSFLRAGALFSAIRLLALFATLALLFELLMRRGPASQGMVAAAGVLVAVYIAAMAWVRVTRMATFAAIFAQDAPAQAVEHSASE